MKRLAAIVLAVACAPVWTQVHEAKCNRSATQTQCSPLDGGTTVYNPNVGQKPSEATQ